MPLALLAVAAGVGVVVAVLVVEGVLAGFTPAAAGALGGAIFRPDFGSYLAVPTERGAAAGAVGLAGETGV